MRLCLLGLVFATALLSAQVGTPQGMLLQTPAPDAYSAGAPWELYHQPIVASGLTYYPTREMRVFDGQVMTQVDVYDGVPVYADMSIEPFTLVYVPLTPTRMRTYERSPNGDPWFISGRGRFDMPAPVGTAGSDEFAPAYMEAAPFAPAMMEEAPLAPAVSEVRVAPTAPIGMESILKPRRPYGVWVQFEGIRWNHDGAADLFTPGRFEQVGGYHGFPVYRDRRGSADRIWIATTDGGLLTPYRKH
jgi:hypothetical protein